MKRICFPLFVLTFVLAVAANAQTNLRGWHSDGQTWLVWTDNQTFTGAETYSVYVSSTPIASVAAASLTARLFPGDWKATRLKRAGANLRWTIPNATGGTYTLAANEAMFTYTPHAAVPEYFAVVKTGNTALTAGTNNLTAPIAQTLAPVTCHEQSTGIDAASGQTYRTYAFWLDGRADYTANRADFPVMGNEHFNGAACLFGVFDPPGGVRTYPMPAVLVMHGHGGAWTSGGPAPSTTYMNRHLDDGLVVNLDDHQFFYDATNVTGDGPGVIDSETRWFGYATSFDRFVNAARTSLPNGSLVVPYTMRRNAWIVDWLIAHRNADPHRVALMGHSMGAGGTHLNVRYTPEKYCAAIAFEGPTAATDNDLGIYMQGTQAQNLPTAQLGGLGVAQVYNPVNALSTNELPLLNFVWGVNDPTVVWSGKATVINNLDATRRGHRLWWDERVHQPPWAGHWVGTPRLGAQHLVGFRNDQSFPAFSADNQPDSDPTVAVPGSTTAKNWGVKNGYYDWDTSTITDTTVSWSATIYLVGSSTFAADVPAFASATANVGIRRAQRFKPVNGASLTWSLRRVSDGVILQSGTASSVSNLVTITNVTLFKDPVRCRLEVKYTGSNVEPISLALLTGTPPPSLALPQGGAAAQSSLPVQLQLSGLVGQSGYLEASSDLMLWEPLETITLSAPQMLYLDALSATFTRRFYRTRLP